MTVAVTLEAPLARRRVSDVARDYLALTKPRVIVLLEVTAVAAMVIAARGWPGWRLVALTVAGGWLAASGANAINCWFDRDIDPDMGRTRTRPLPAGRIEPRQALAFGIALGAASFALLATTVNLLSACLALLALLFYVFVYTMWLKRSSMQNIVIGGAAGAIPPLVGWAAVTGSLEHHRDLPLRGRLLLDPAALLGALPAHQGRLRPRRRADDARRAGRAPDPVPDRAVHDRPVPRDGAPAAHPVVRGRVPRRRRGPRHDPADRRRHRLTPADGALGTAALLPFHDVPGSALRGHGDRPRDRASEEDAPMNRKLARKNIRMGVAMFIMLLVLMGAAFVWAAIFLAVTK